MSSASMLLLFVEVDEPDDENGLPIDSAEPCITCCCCIADFPMPASPAKPPLSRAAAVVGDVAADDDECSAPRSKSSSCK